MSSPRYSSASAHEVAAPPVPLQQPSCRRDDQLTKLSSCRVYASDLGRRGQAHFTGQPYLATCVGARAGLHATFWVCPPAVFHEELN